MRRARAAGLAFAAMSLVTTPVTAGIYSDDLAKCMVRSSSNDDQVDLVRWIFAVMALHPVTQDYAKVTPEARTEGDKKAAALVMRLLTVDCRAETLAAVKYEGPGVFENAFRVLGEVAMRGIMNDPKVQKGFEGWGNSLDKDKLGDLFKEAGINKNPLAPGAGP